MAVQAVQAVDLEDKGLEEVSGDQEVVLEDQEEVLEDQEVVLEDKALAEDSVDQGVALVGLGVQEDLDDNKFKYSKFQI